MLHWLGQLVSKHAGGKSSSQTTGAHTDSVFQEPVGAFLPVHACVYRQHESPLANIGTECVSTGDAWVRETWYWLVCPLNHLPVRHCGFGAGDRDEALIRTSGTVCAQGRSMFSKPPVSTRWKLINMCTFNAIQYYVCGRECVVFKDLLR